MPHKPNDLDRVYHLLEAARKIRRHIAGKTYEDFERDELLHLSVVHLLEIIGEAASGIAPAFRANYPSVPWRALIDMRNRLIHVYFNISLKIVWATVTKNLPMIERELCSLFPALTD
jgi:uncharacterized protein with HEPN domain